MSFVWQTDSNSRLSVGLAYTKRIPTLKKIAEKCFSTVWQQQLSWRLDYRPWLFPPLFSLEAKKWPIHVLLSLGSHWQNQQQKLTETIFVEVNLINSTRVALREVFQRENNRVTTLPSIGRSCSYLYVVNFCCRINLADICLLSDDQNKTYLFQFSSRNTPRSLLGTRWRPGCYTWRRAYWRIWYSPVIPFGRFNVSCGLDCWWFYPVLYFLSKEKGRVWRKTSCRTHGWFLTRFNEGKWEVRPKFMGRGETASFEKDRKWRKVRLIDFSQDRKMGRRGKRRV